MDRKPIKTVGRLAVVQIIEQHPVRAVLWHHEPKGRIHGGGIKSRATNIDWTFLHLFHGAHLHLALVIFRNPLHAKVRIGRHAEALADYFEPIYIIFFCIERHPIAITSRKKCANIFARHRKFLGGFRLIIGRTGLGDHVVSSKMNAYRIGHAGRAGQSIIHAVKARSHWPHGGAAGDVHTRGGITGKIDGNHFFL